MERGRKGGMERVVAENSNMMVDAPAKAKALVWRRHKDTRGRTPLRFERSAMAGEQILDGGANLLGTPYQLTLSFIGLRCISNEFRS